MDLTTTYLGQKLPHPFVPGAGPLVADFDMARRLVDAGAPMLTMWSLFEEELRRESIATTAAVDGPKNQFAEALSYLPEPDEFTIGPDDYLEHLGKLKAATGVPIVGSLNGISRGGWLSYAEQIEAAGAAALELNLYRVAVDEDRSAADIEDESVAIVKEVCGSIRIPVAVKLSPFYTSLPHFASRLVGAGAKALVLFNRFYQPEIDVEELELKPRLLMSDSSELNLRLRWLSILAGRLGGVELAVTGGVHTAIDGLKAVMAGASACQVVCALLANGPQRLELLRTQLADWLTQHEYESLAQARGSMSLTRGPEPESILRANYVHVLRSWSGVTMPE